LLAKEQVSSANQQQKDAVEFFHCFTADIGLVGKECPEEIADNQAKSDDDSVFDIQVAVAIVDNGCQDAKIAFRSNPEKNRLCWTGL